ncbi:hypothetical protein [Pseudochrobactrum sp. HB0163]|uniref:hypothetical protein n=1 Tax=Pseudochrobactrum sp. HB0163 TaxID=3450708 RepID=UPI003F6E02DA
MDFLLWIALIGVIIFLLGLIYSKFNNQSAKEPAAKTISPAISPASPAARNEAEDKSAAQANKPAPQPKPAEAAHHHAPASALSPASGLPATPAATLVATKAESRAPAIKSTPAAEPVGPAYGKAATSKNSEAGGADIPAKEKEPAPSHEPELLKKPRRGIADDLTQIGGIGKAIQEKLYKAGIFHYDQLADLNPEQTAWLNRAIGFAGRAERENWSAQAKKLMTKPAGTKPAATSKAAASSTAKKSAAKAKTKPAAKPKAKPAKKA